MLQELTVAIKDDSGYAEEVGSSYAFEFPTRQGTLLALFRLNDGDTNKLEVVAFYLNDVRLTGAEATAAKELLVASFEPCDWLLA